MLIEVEENPEYGLIVSNENICEVFAHPVYSTILQNGGYFKRIGEVVYLRR